MAWLILNDEIDYTATWYPTHIVSKDREPLPVFVGAASTMLRGFIGLYVRDKDYHKIRHDKAYIFLHDPDVEKDGITNIDWDKIADVKDSKTVGRDHIHLWKEAEFGEQK